MQVTVETLSPLQRRMTVSLPMQPIEQEIGQRLFRLARTAKMAGFRPGKVPINLIQKNYGAQVRDEVISGEVERSFNEAASQNQLRVAGYPSIEPSPADGRLEYIATFEVFPEVVIGDLSSSVIDRPVLTVGEKDVDKTIEVLRKQRVTFEAVKRAAKKGDQINIAFRAEIDGKEVESTQSQGINLVLGEDGRVAEFDDNLVGAKLGAEMKFDITYGEENPSVQLAGKTVTYQVTVNSIAQPVLPEVDAEFAVSLGVESGDVAKMRDEIKRSLEQEVSKRVRAVVKQQAFQALLNQTSLELPNALLELEVNRLLQVARKELEQRGVDVANVNLDESVFAEQAKRNVSLRLILGELVGKHGLQAKPEQIRAMVDDFANSFERPDEIVRWYYADPQRLDEPVALATEENAVAWVLERAQVTEKKVKFDEFMGNKT